MKRRFMNMYAVLMAMCALLATIHAAEPEAADAEETIKVMAVGMGKDSDAALKNALKNAVSQAVGTLVDTQTIVENDAVIKDQILSHSGGFVEDYAMIGSPEADDGLVSVKIEAVVKKMNLKRKMEAANIIHVEKIDGKLYTRQIQVEEANAMFYEMLKDFPRGYIEHKMIGKPYYDDKKKRFVVEVKSTLDTEKVKDLTKRMADFLEAALPEPPITFNTDISFNENSVILGVPEIGQKKVFFYPVFISANKTKATWKLYPLTDGMMKVLEETIFNRPTMTIDLTIEGDITILSDTWTLPRPYKIETASYMGTYGGLVIMPMLHAPTSASPGDWFEPGKPEVTRFYTFDLAPEDVQQIKDVKMRLN